MKILPAGIEQFWKTKISALGLSLLNKVPSYHCYSVQMYTCNENKEHCRDFFSFSS